MGQGFISYSRYAIISIRGMGGDSIYKYIIKDIPPSTNKYIGRTNRWEYQDDKELWSWLIREAVGRNKPKKALGKSIVLIEYYFKSKRERDPDNYIGKFIMDGLVDAGVLENDSFDHVMPWPEQHRDKNNPRVEIYVKEIDKETQNLLDSLKGKIKGGMENVKGKDS